MHTHTYTRGRTPLYQAYRTYTIGCIVYIHILTHVERELYGIILIQDQNGTRDSWRVTLLFSVPDVIISRQRTYYRYMRRNMVHKYIIYIPLSFEKNIIITILGTFSMPPHFSSIYIYIINVEYGQYDLLTRLLL